MEAAVVLLCFLASERNLLSESSFIVLCTTKKKYLKCSQKCWCPDFPTHCHPCIPLKILCCYKVLPQQTASCSFIQVFRTSQHSTYGCSIATGRTSSGEEPTPTDRPCIHVDCFRTCCIGLIVYKNYAYSISKYLLCCRRMLAWFVILATSRRNMCVLLTLSAHA